MNWYAKPSAKPTQIYQSKHFDWTKTNVTDANHTSPLDGDVILKTDRECWAVSFSHRDVYSFYMRFLRSVCRDSSADRLSCSAKSMGHNEARIAAVAFVRDDFFTVGIKSKKRERNSPQHRKLWVIATLLPSPEASHSSAPRFNLPFSLSL